MPVKLTGGEWSEEGWGRESGNTGEEKATQKEFVLALYLKNAFSEKDSQCLLHSLPSVYKMQFCKWSVN